MAPVAAAVRALGGLPGTGRWRAASLGPLGGPPARPVAGASGRDPHRHRALPALHGRAARRAVHDAHAAAGAGGAHAVVPPPPPRADTRGWRPATRGDLRRPDPLRVAPQPHGQDAGPLGGRDDQRRTHADGVHAGPARTGDDPVAHGGRGRLPGALRTILRRADQPVRLGPGCAPLHEPDDRGRRVRRAPRPHRRGQRARHRAVRDRARWTRSDRG